MGAARRPPRPATLLAQKSALFGTERGLPDASSSWKRIVVTSGAPLAMSLFLVGLATGALLLIGPISRVNLAPIAYLIPVMVAATRWGIGPAIVAAIASTAAADFFFYPPFYSFRLDDRQAGINLLLFLAVALVSGNLASRLRRETETLKRSEHELQFLYGFSRRLAACHTVSDLAEAIRSYLSKTFGQHTAFFLPAAETVSRQSPGQAVPQIVRDNAALMIKPGGPRSRLVQDENGGRLWLLHTVVSGEVTHSVIAVDAGGGPRIAVDERTDRVEAILKETVQTLEHLNIGGAMEEASFRLKNQLLRDAFHSDLSHELRSPLAAIRGSASVLETIPAIKNGKQTYSLVSAITNEVERLDSFIGNLLHATRVSASDIRPHLACADPRDIINAAIRRRSRGLAAHHVRMSFDSDLPMVNVDSVLIEEAFGQLLENAAKYSPPGSTIRVNARAGRGRVTLSISDEGSGITEDERAQLGRRSFRGERHRATISGAGFGFWIASTFVKANDGSLEVESGGQGQGTTASIVLPEAAIEEETPDSSDE
jgi:K+-sensing histidine kinase KdpD